MPDAHLLREADVRGDLDAILELRRAWSDPDADEPAFRGRLGDWLTQERDRRTIWLAEIDGQAVGMVSLVEVSRMPRPGRPDTRWGYVAQLFVVPATRRRGIGGHLVRHVIDVAGTRGYERLVLSPSRDAEQLVRAAGFTPPQAPDPVLLSWQNPRGPIRLTG